MRETPAEKAEASAIRRRWVTLGEAVAVAGVIIGGLTLWNSWDERRSQGEVTRAEAARASASATRLDLRTSVIEGGRQVDLSDPAHELLETTVTFPAALGVSDRSPMLPRIKVDWFTSALRGATDGGRDRIEGRLPVLVAIRYRAGDTTRQDRAIVDVAWRTSGRMFAGRGVRIEAARVRERGGDQARIDALWAAELKRLKVTR